MVNTELNLNTLLIGRYTCNKCLVLIITIFKMMGVVIRYAFVPTGLYILVRTMLKMAFLRHAYIPRCKLKDSRSELM